MDLIQPLFLNQSGRTETAELGVANSSWSQTFIFDVIQKDIDKGVDSFLLFIKPEEKTWTSDWNYQAEMVAKIKKQFPKNTINCRCLFVFYFARWSL